MTILAKIQKPPMNNKFLFRCLGWAIVLVVVIGAGNITGAAQEPTQWSPQQRIPDYDSGTGSPFLIADQNRTVHAFTYQPVGDDGQKEIAVLYNQWTLEQGWTAPIDILLSPLKQEARLMGAFLDQSGMMHVIFFGGDETEANIYYAKAPALSAGRAAAWSVPRLIGEQAANPSVAALTGDAKGRLVIVYSGIREGRGLYALYSADGGDTWTDPTPAFLTYSDVLFPAVLKLSLGQSGWIHAVWDVRDLGGNGRQINYAKLNLGDQQWSEPVTLEEVETGYGVLSPTVVEHRDSVIVAYSGVTLRDSSDGGQTWTDPVRPFRQVGINGTMSFVIDTNNDLHLFWGQRITGSPDIHGTWHSVWQGDDRWSEPEAVVSGPQVSDLIGDKAFDPYDVRAAVSQGNVILVTWRSDPGLKGNGVWYSYKRLDAPELPVVALPTVPSTATPVLATTTPPPSPTPTPRPVLVDQNPNGSTDSFQRDNPAGPVVIGIVPIALIILAIFVRSFLVYQNRR